MPYLSSGTHGKNETFQKLKPTSVALSQAILVLTGSQKDVRLVQDRLEGLYVVLSGIADGRCYFDDKLADYVFFPVSQVLKLSQKVSIRCLELALAIVAILIQRGWSAHVQQQLAQQLLILCTLLISESPSLASNNQTTPELQRNALFCLEQLFAALGTSSTGRTLLVNDANIPHLGQTISSMLQTVHQSTSPDVQIAAVRALTALFGSTHDRQILLSFLPGVTSSLTKILALQSARRRRPEVLVASLGILERLIEKVFHDPPATGSTIETDTKDEPESAAQIRLAIANIVRLREHDRHDVRNALGQFCMTILRHCQQNLRNCNEITLETILALPEQDLHFEIVMLMTTNSSILAAVQSIIFSWLQSLARIMQGSNDDAKTQRLRQIGTAYQCLVNAGIDTTTTNQMLGRTLNDCVVLTLKRTGKAQLIENHDSITALQLHMDETRDVQHFTALTTSPSQVTVLKDIQILVALVSANDTSRSLTDGLILSLSTSQGDQLVADFWLLLQQLNASLAQSQDVNDMINIAEENRALQEQIEDVFAFAISLLTDATQQLSPVLTSLALQAFALQAQSTGREFRLELIDALYPVLHALATPHQTIQHDSMVTLNIFSKSCEYASVQDLIVGNVDYLTNAVALKLNSFDVSPQAPQVLLMMVRLAGPRLVPYLEDIVESIFAALEDFHGYPLLVELLFKTLSAIADEGSKAPSLDTRQDTPLLLVHRGAESRQPRTVDSLVELIRDRSATKTDVEPADEFEHAPQRPWSKEKSDEDVPQQQPSEEDLPPPAPKTYNLLVRITELTQHFLPSASPALRKSLLSLIHTTVPAISRHENTFLPLINTLWPEIISRLEDDEPSIRAAALEIVSVLCEYAKDFMRSRIVDLWPMIRNTWREVVKDISTEPSVKRRIVASDSTVMRISNQAKQDIQRMQSTPADYSNTSARHIWQAVVELLTVVVRSVPITPEMFDEALEMARPSLVQPEVESAFEQENADAVWLSRLKEDRITVQWQPPLDQGFIRVS